MMKNSIKASHLYSIFTRRGLIHLNKCRNHDHLTRGLGDYLDPPYETSNLLYSIDTKLAKIPCTLHTLQGYNAHLVLSAAQERHSDVSFIVNNTKKYISFKIAGVKFIDSAQFMLALFDKIVKNLRDEDFKETI